MSSKSNGFFHLFKTINLPSEIMRPKLELMLYFSFILYMSLPSNIYHTTALHRTSNCELQDNQNDQIIYRHLFTKQSIRFVQRTFHLHLWKRHITPTIWKLVLMVFYHCFFFTDRIHKITEKIFNVACLKSHLSRFH